MTAAWHQKSASAGREDDSRKQESRAEARASKVVMMCPSIPKQVENLLRLTLSGQVQCPENTGMYPDYFGNFILLRVIES